MKGLILAVMTVMFGFTNLFAQTISLESATEGKWSGGVVGRSGVNYRIMLKVKKKKITFDSVYINNRGYAISPAGPQRGNLWLDTAKHIYTIGVSEWHNARPDPATNKTEEPYKGPMRTFSGKALIIYTCKKKKRLFIVKEMKELPPKMYP